MLTSFRSQPFLLRSVLRDMFSRLLCPDFKKHHRIAKSERSNLLQELLTVETHTKARGRY